MAPATKMQGFGSDDLGLTRPGQSCGQTQHADIHNKPAPKNFWHAASRFASTTWDVVKPGDDKKGHTGADARKAAGDVFLGMTGVCKYTGAVNPVEERMRCPCAGCQSFDNEKCLRQNKEAEELDLARQKKEAEARKAASERAVQDARDAGQRPKVAGYVAPNLSLPVSEPQSQQRGPWGPAQYERKEERSVEQQSPALVMKPDPAPQVDLLGGGEQASPFAFVNTDPAPATDQSTDLLGGEPAVVETADLLGETQESRDLTNLLMSHAAADDEEETDLIGLAPAMDTKPAEQLDGLF